MICNTVRIPPTDRFSRTVGLPISTQTITDIKDVLGSAVCFRALQVEKWAKFAILGWGMVNQCWLRDSAVEFEPLMGNVKNVCIRKVIVGMRMIRNTKTNESLYYHLYRRWLIDGYVCKQGDVWSVGCSWSKCGRGIETAVTVYFRINYPFTNLWYIIGSQRFKCSGKRDLSRFITCFSKLKEI